MFVALNYLTSCWVYHWHHKVRIVVLHVSYVAGTSLHDVKDMGRVSASRNVIAVSACWLINCALACTPPSICAGGMMITGDVVVHTLVDPCYSVVGCGSVIAKIQYMYF